MLFSFFFLLHFLPVLPLLARNQPIVRMRLVVTQSECRGSCFIAFRVNKQKLYISGRKKRGD